MLLDQLERFRGVEVGVSEWFTVDQARIDAFAAATLDHQWIHVDPGRAAAGPFGATIAHGFLTLSLISHLGSQIPLPLEGVRMTVNYGLDRVRFITPVRVGSRIRARRTILTADAVDDGVVQVKNLMTVDLDGTERPACVAETLTRYHA